MPLTHSPRSAPHNLTFVHLKSRGCPHPLYHAIHIPQHLSTESGNQPGRDGGGKRRSLASTPFQNGSPPGPARRGADTQFCDTCQGEYRRTGGHDTGITKLANHSAFLLRDTTTCAHPEQKVGTEPHTPSRRPAWVGAFCTLTLYHKESGAYTKYQN